MRVLLLLLASIMASSSFAYCSDRDAIAAGEALGRSYFKKSEVFHLGKVLKVHHPSRDKEVAAYIKTGEKHYSIFSLVDESCQARFIKRTRQND